MEEEIKREFYCKDRRFCMQESENSKARTLCNVIFTENKGDRSPI